MRIAGLRLQRQWIFGRRGIGRCRGIDGLVSIEVSPEAIEVLVDGTAATDISYTATGTFDDASTRDVTAEVSFALLDSSLGDFNANVLTPTRVKGGATVVLVPARSGHTPVGLDNANAPGVGDLGQTHPTNSFPKWSPFVFRRDKEQGERLEWLTFSSRRNYGLRSPSGGDMLIWMVAVEPDKALAGEDPSSAAFAIPYQDLDTSNHIAQWTERIIVVQ